MKAREKLIISKEAYVDNFQINDGKFLYWTDDKEVELPIIIGAKDDVPAKTIPQVFHETVKKYPHYVALKVKRKMLDNDKEFKNVKWDWDLYYKDCMSFAASLIKIGVQERKSVNIIGFNSPEWAIAFFGSIFANNVPSGVYTTNTKESCLY